MRQRTASDSGANLAVAQAADQSAAASLAPVTTEPESTQDQPQPQSDCYFAQAPVTAADEQGVATHTVELQLPAPDSVPDRMEPAGLQAGELLARQPDAEQPQERTASAADLDGSFIVGQRQQQQSPQLQLQQQLLLAPRHVSSAVLERRGGDAEGACVRVQRCAVTAPCCAQLPRTVPDDGVLTTVEEAAEPEEEDEASESGTARHASSSATGLHTVSANSMGLRLASADSPHLYGEALCSWEFDVFHVANKLGAPVAAAADWPARLLTHAAPILRQAGPCVL